jgi:copper transport protein
VTIPTTTARLGAICAPKVAVGALVCALALALPASAGAHAVVKKTEPQRDTTVAEPPHAVYLYFNEPVEAAFGAIRIYDARGERVDSGPIERPSGRQDAAGVHMRSDAGKGVYTATYRVVSADGHPVEGGFSFGVGVSLTAPGGERPPPVSQLLANESNTAVEVVYGVARGLHYLALLMLIGACAYAVAIGPASRRVVAAACATGLVMALAAIALQGLLASNASLAHALDAATIEGSLDTRTGAAWAMRAGIWVLAVGLARSRLDALVLAPAASALAVSMPLAGHAWTQSPRGLLVAADLVHVVAAGAWLGALVLLVIDRAQIDAVRRFSRMALPAIVALVVAGTVQAIVYLDSFRDLVADPYGIAILGKIALLGGIVVLAARNRPALRRDGRGLAAAMRAEVVLALLVIAATAVLVRLSPTAAEASGPDYRNVDVGPLRMQMVIEPQRVGANVAHLYFYDRRSGDQVDGLKEVQLRLTQPERRIGPIVVRVPRRSFAHYELRGLTFGTAGTWRIRVQARVSEFDEYTADTTLDVAR